MVDASVGAFFLSGGPQMGVKKYITDTALICQYAQSYCNNNNICYQYDNAVLVIASFCMKNSEFRTWYAFC
jgi:uncharacterized protein YodC (DUF2158 family)